MKKTMQKKKKRRTWASFIPFLLVLAVLFAGLNMTGTLASQVNISSQTAAQSLFTGPWNGATAVLTGANATYGPGAGLDRNMTYFFNVSPYVGNTLSNFRIWRFYSDTWGTSGAATAVCVYARSFSGSFSQAVAGTNATTCVATSSLLGNATYFDWASPSFSVLGGNLTATYFFSPLAITGWNEAGAGTLDTWAILSFDTGNLTPSGFSPTVSSAGYYPIDSSLSDTFNSANALSFLTDSRKPALTGGETAYALVQGSDGSSRYAKVWQANRTILVFSFNSSKLSSPNQLRAFIQVEGDYAVSPVLEHWGSNYVTLTARDRFWAPISGASISNEFFLPSYAMEVYTHSDGTDLVRCWAYETGDTLSSSEVVRAVCTAPEGMDASSDRVLLTWSNGTDIATITNSSRSDYTGAVEFVSGTDADYAWKVVTSSRGNVTKALGGTDETAAVKLTWSNDGGASMFSFSAADSSKAPFLDLPKPQQMYFTGIDLADYSVHEEYRTNETISRRIVIFADSSEWVTSGPKASGVQYAYADSFLGFTTTDIDFQLGTVTYYSSAASGSATVSCGTSGTVSVLANIPQDVPCPVSLSVYRTDFQNPSIILSPSQVVETNGVLYRLRRQTSATPTSASVTDYVSNARIDSSLSGSILTLLSQSYPENVSRTFLASIGASNGHAYSTPFSVFFAVSPTLPNVTSNFNAVFISLDASDANLADVTVSVGGGASECVTALGNVTVGNGTVPFAWCSMMLPAQLTGLVTNYTYWNGTDMFWQELTQTYFGAFGSDAFAGFGLLQGSQGGVYYVRFTGVAIEVEGSRQGTCVDPAVWLQTVGGQDICTPRSCPLTTNIVEAGGYSITPYAVTCVSVGTSECRHDAAYDVTYLVSCGNVCQAIVRACPTGCNADNSGCAGDSVRPDGSGLTGQWVNGASWWITWASDNSIFVLALVLALAIFVIAASSRSEAAMKVGGPIALFVLVGGAILSLPGGLAVFIGVLLIAAIFGGFLLFGGRGRGEG